MKEKSEKKKNPQEEEKLKKNLTFSQMFYFLK